MTLLALLGIGRGAFLSLTGSSLSSNTIYERFFSGTDVEFKANVTCSVGCRLEAIFFDESLRQSIFPGEFDYRPVCCLPTDSECEPGTLRLIPNPTGRVVTAGDWDRPVNVSFQGTSIWSVVVANCGNPMVLARGEFDISARSGPMDLRLTWSCWIFGGFFVLLVGLVLVFLWRVIRTKPKVPSQHKLFLGVSAVVGLSLLGQTGHFIYWRILGPPPILVAVPVAIVRALAPVGLLYFAFVGLQYPLDVDWQRFARSLAPFLISSFCEVYGITTFAKRTTGSWLLGFGPFVPFLDLVILSTAIIAILGFAWRSPPAEVDDEKKRRLYLVVLLGAFVLFFVSSFGLMIVRLGSTLIESQNFEWVPFVLQPAFMLSLTAAHAWFWWSFNPLGWGNLDNQKTADIQLMAEEDSDSGVIPKVPTRGNGRKRKKSDHGFAELDTDDFSDEERPPGKKD
jgi:hypothetical protein